MILIKTIDFIPLPHIFSIFFLKTFVILRYNRVCTFVFDLSVGFAQNLLQLSIVAANGGFLAYCRV